MIEGLPGFAFSAGQALPRGGRRSCGVFVLGFAVAALAVSGGQALAATASPAVVRDLAAQVNRLDDQVASLRRQAGEDAPAGQVMRVADNATMPSNVATDFEVRLSRLEAEIQDLTGKYQEASHQVQELQSRLDKMQSDMDYRLSAIEQKTGTGGGPPPSSGSTANPPAEHASGPTIGSLGTLSPKEAAAAENHPPIQVPPESSGGALPQGSERQQYDYAFGLLRQANYPQAETALKSFIAQHPSGSLSSAARYWLGETYYVRGKYTEAAVAFAEGFQKDPKGSKAPDNLLKLGMSLSALHKTQDACTAFNQFNTQFPNATNALKSKVQQERQRLHCS